MNGIDHKSIQAQNLAARLFNAGLAAAELMSAYLGVRLGLYEALASQGPANVQQLADRAGIAARYAREWLEQQAVSGMVEIDEPAKAPEDRLYFLPEGHAEALTDADSLNWIAPIAVLPVGGLVQVLPRLLEAYRQGGGVAYAEYSTDFRGGRSGLNRPLFLHHLPRWIKTVMPDVHAQLGAGGARVADVGCGVGWSSIALARAYPQLRIDGFDRDESSLSDACLNAAEAGVGDRLRFESRIPCATESGGLYNLIGIFDALHDMARPVEMLRLCRTLLTEDGSVLLMEPNVAESFSAPGNEIERYMYAISLLHCLPVGLSEQPSVGTGTVMRPDTVRAYASEAGFEDFQILPIEHRFYRLYRLKRGSGGEAPK
jgi:2-polyprenyl-3-methyl-5-hydroxy-6-metoxy-1,4-benzoquinol methylase